MKKHILLAQMSFLSLGILSTIAEAGFFDGIRSQIGGVHNRMFGPSSTKEDQRPSSVRQKKGAKLPPKESELLNKVFGTHVEGILNGNLKKMPGNVSWGRFEKLSPADQATLIKALESRVPILSGEKGDAMLAFFRKMDGIKNRGEKTNRAGKASSASTPSFARAESVDSLSGDNSLDEFFTVTSGDVEALKAEVERLKRGVAGFAYQHIADVQEARGFLDQVEAGAPRQVSLANEIEKAENLHDLMNYHKEQMEYYSGVLSDLQEEQRDFQNTSEQITHSADDQLEWDDADIIAKGTEVDRTGKTAYLEKSIYHALEFLFPEDFKERWLRIEAESTKKTMKDKIAYLESWLQKLEALQTSRLAERSYQKKTQVSKRRADEPLDGDYTGKRRPLKQEEGDLDVFKSPLVERGLPKEKEEVGIRRHISRDLMQSPKNTPLQGMLSAQDLQVIQKNFDNFKAVLGRVKSAVSGYLKKHVPSHLKDEMRSIDGLSKITSYETFFQSATNKMVTNTVELLKTIPGSDALIKRFSSTYKQLSGVLNHLDPQVREGLLNQDDRVSFEPQDRGYRRADSFQGGYDF